MSLFLGNRGTKLYKLEDENIASKFIKRGTNKENVWEHGNIGQFWKGNREQGPPSWETLNGQRHSKKRLFIRTPNYCSVYVSVHFLGLKTQLYFKKKRNKREKGK